MTNPYTRTPRMQAKYDKHKEKVMSSGCPFCFISTIQDQILETYDHWLLLVNKFPYANTQTHLLLVPTRHITRFSQMRQEEFLEWNSIKWSFIQKHGDLEDLTRSDNNPDKSVYHLHTHLIKYE